MVAIDLGDVADGVGHGFFTEPCDLVAHRDEAPF
jgi:hypothetical protein